MKKDIYSILDILGTKDIPKYKDLLVQNFSKNQEEGLVLKHKDIEISFSKPQNEDVFIVRVNSGELNSGEYRANSVEETVDIILEKLSTYE